MSTSSVQVQRFPPGETPTPSVLLPHLVKYLPTSNGGTFNYNCWACRVSGFPGVLGSWVAGLLGCENQQARRSIIKFVT